VTAIAKGDADRNYSTRLMGFLRSAYTGNARPEENRRSDALLRARRVAGGAALATEVPLLNSALKGLADNIEERGLCKNNKRSVNAESRREDSPSWEIPEKIKAAMKKEEALQEIQRLRIAGCVVFSPYKEARDDTGTPV